MQLRRRAERFRRNGRAVEGGSLENCYAERHRGFESYFLRQNRTPPLPLSRRGRLFSFLWGVFEIELRASRVSGKNVRLRAPRSPGPWTKSGIVYRCRPKIGIVYRSENPPCGASKRRRARELAFCERSRACASRRGGKGPGFRPKPIHKADFCPRPIHNPGFCP